MSLGKKAQSHLKELGFTSDPRGKARRRTNEGTPWGKVGVGQIQEWGSGWNGKCVCVLHALDYESPCVMHA